MGERAIAWHQNKDSPRGLSVGLVPGLHFPSADVLAGVGGQRA